MLSINISELIWTIINFFLLYFLLKHFLYDPVVRFLDAREARVNEAQARENAARAAREESARQIEEEKSLRREEAKGIVDASHAKDREESLAAQSKARAEGEKSLESAGEHVECLFKVMTTEDVGYTHLLAAGIRGCIESCCGGKHDGLPLVAKICKTPGAKAFGIVNGKMGYSIECSHRLRRVNAGDAVEPTHETISPRLIFLARCGQIGCIGLHGGFGCYLPKKRRRKTSLA